MALSVSILFFFAITVLVSLWGRARYRRDLITSRHARLLLQAFHSARV